MPAEAFLWNPTDPSNVELTITIPQAVPGQDDPFCSGHAWTSDGKALIVGGTNLVADCSDGPEPDKPWGHTRVWVFDNAAYVAGVSAPGFLPATSFSRERWYPTLTQTGDDRRVLTGHIGYPDYSTPTGQTREYGSWSAALQDITWASTSAHFINYRVPSGGCDPLGGSLTLGDFPRVHQLASHALINVRNRGQVLDFNACPGPENERWLDLNFAAPQPQSESNNTAHYVDLRGTPVNSIKEWIVSIAGANIEAGCEPKLPEDPELLISDQVVVMQDPVPGKAWTSLPSLNKARTEANTVVTLSGEMVVVGGYATEQVLDQLGQLVTVSSPRKRPELFRPGFLFGGTLASTAWKDLCPQQHDRAYHSVAALMQDGRILSAGGDYPCDSGLLDNGYETVELFSPPSLFGGSRPRIQSLSESILHYGNSTPLTINVLLQGGNTGEFRVAMLRAGSVTHAFDCNQRYVVLDTDAVTSHFAESPAVSTLVVHKPSQLQQDAAPPGYYMLTVVNSAGRAASAKWIQILP